MLRCMQNCQSDNTASWCSWAITKLKDYQLVQSHTPHSVQQILTGGREGIACTDNNSSVELNTRNAVIYYYAHDSTCVNHSERRLFSHDAQLPENTHTHTHTNTHTYTHTNTHTHKHTHTQTHTNTHTHIHTHKENK